MSITELIDNLSERGVQFSVGEGEKLRIKAPKGAIARDMQSLLAERKPEIIAYLQKRQSEADRNDAVGSHGLGLATIGRIIGGFCSESAPQHDFQCPVIDARSMASKLNIAFRPLPKGYRNAKIIDFRTRLEVELLRAGTNVVPWEEATREHRHEITLPLIKRAFAIKTRAVKTDIDAVVDVERKASFVGKLKSLAAETLYRLYSHFVLKGRKLPAAQIARVISWAEENVRSIEDPTNTQSVVLAEFDPEFGNPKLPYQRKIPLGVGALVRTFSEIFIGVSDEKLYVLNMNLSDSVYTTDELQAFVNKSLIPKIFIPILPLPMSRFEVGEFDPQQSSYARDLVDMGKKLEPLGLLPEGFKIDRVVKKPSHRDIVNWISNGRTGVSYGFIALIEPPQYFGPREISSAEWETLAPLKGLDPNEIRRNGEGRRYLRTETGDRIIYQQIPDIWLVSSRSGSKKTALEIASDVVRIGLTERLHMQVPTGSNALKGINIRPSYDLYVMVGIALSAALYSPEFIQAGAPIFHFHGYPSVNWFQANEYCTGVRNPSVPCGTYESGVFNFLGVEAASEQSGGNAQLIGLIEPDHGTNIIARDINYLLDRLKRGVLNNQIELGGQYLFELRENANANN